MNKKNHVIIIGDDEEVTRKILRKDILDSALKKIELPLLTIIQETDVLCTCGGKISNYCNLSTSLTYCMSCKKGYTIAQFWEQKMNRITEGEK